MVLQIQNPRVQGNYAYVREQGGQTNQRSQPRHWNETGQTGAREVIQKIKENALTQTATVAVAGTVVEHTDSFATQLALPRKDYLARTANSYRRNSKICLFLIPEL